MTYIRASDIGRSTVIIGLLGHPIGKLITIEGEWYLPDISLEKDIDPKNDRLWLRINAVDGETPTLLVRFPSTRLTRAWRLKQEPPPPEIGDVWQLRGVESGGYKGTPPRSFRTT